MERRSSMESVACDNTKCFTDDLRLRFLVYPAQGFFHDITGLSHWNDVKTVALFAQSLFWFVLAPSLETLQGCSCVVT